MKSTISKASFALVLFFTALGLWWGWSEGPLRNPQKALADFYEARDRAEDQLMDPLILNGRRVVPYVIRDIQNRDMKLRRYAIGFLGNGRYTEAVPILERILSDESEIYYFRSDALEAIYQISPWHARELAPRFMNGPQLLGSVARDIAEGRNPTHWTRTYKQAFFHVHE